MESDGSWNGMVRMLIDDATDMIVSPLTWTLQRHDVVDFTIPLERDVATLLAPAKQGTCPIGI